MWNNKAQLGMYVYVFMLAVVVIILALALAYPVNESNSLARTEMNCSGTTDDFVSAGCLISDIGQAYFVGGLLAIAGLLIGAKVLFS
jgi:hypothetical protein